MLGEIRKNPRLMNSGFWKFETLAIVFLAPGGNRLIICSIQFPLNDNNLFPRFFFCNICVFTSFWLPVDCPSVVVSLLHYSYSICSHLPYYFIVFYVPKLFPLRYYYVRLRTYSFFWQIPSKCAICQPTIFLIVPVFLYGVSAYVVFSTLCQHIWSKFWKLVRKWLSQACLLNGFLEANWGW